jgi:hypothetical protein
VAAKLAASIVAVVALGVLVGRIVAGDPAATRTFRVGGADVTVAGPWQQLDPGKLARGGERLLVTLDDGPTVGVAASSGAAAASPVPGIPGSGAPQRVRLGGYDAWGYGDARVLPTTRGMLTVECRCGDAVRAVSVPGAAILEPAPDLALRLRAPAVLKRLDATRAKERAAWTPASAARLGAAHRTALDELGALATPDLARALTDAANAYDDLARTPSASPADLTAADHALDAAVAPLVRAGAPRIQKPAPAPDDGGVSMVTLALIALAAALAVALAPPAWRRLRDRAAPPDAAARRDRVAAPDDAARRRRRDRAPAPGAERRVPAAAPGRAGSSPNAAPRRREPARLFGRDLKDVVVTGPGQVEAEEPRAETKPPAYGRWDEPPKGAVPEDGAREAATASSSTT